jgi:hypothetical protein
LAYAGLDHGPPTGAAGYTITRYQGDTAFFNAQTHALDLLAANKRRAIVDRDSQIVVSDSGIYYTETDRKVVTGGKYTLSPPPSSGQADIKGVGRVDYDLADRSARITRAKLPVNNGQMWYMDVALARVILDTGKIGVTDRVRPWRFGDQLRRLDTGLSVRIQGGEADRQ